MPSYKGHLAGGVAAYVVVLQAIKYLEPNIHIIIQGFLFCLLGSLFPDIDTKSKGQKVFYLLLLLFLIYCLVMQRWNLFVVVSLLGILPMLVRHRGLFHEIWFLFFIALFSTIIIKSLQSNYEHLLLANSWFFFAGCLSHVFLDRFLTKLKRTFYYK